MTNEIDIQWKECLQILADNLPATAFQTWFAPIRPLKYADGVLVLQVKSQFIAEYIEDNYIDILSRTIIRVYGIGTKLEYRVLIDSTSGAGSNIPSSGLNRESELKANQLSSYMPTIKVPQDNFDTQLNELYTFESFVSGEPNKLARTAGLAVSKQPGSTAFNPLFIYGGSGVGKTHLANAIGNQAKLLNPHARVLYVSANTFKLQFQDAHNLNRIPDFLNFYQSVDVLIVDDIQYFAGLKGTQDTFFHIFNYLQQSRKQLILTSDRPPLALKDIEDRLLTRFKWGLAAEIKRPDYQLRRDILLHKMHRDGVVLSEELIEFIASHVTESVRDLEGVLASLLAHSTLTNSEIDIQLAEQVVSRIVQLTPQHNSMDEITGAVSEHFNIDERFIKGKGRSSQIMLARHISMYLCKELCENLSLAEIGKYFGHRTHATVLHSANTMQQKMEYDASLRQHIHQIKEALKR